MPPSSIAIAASDIASSYVEMLEQQQSQLVAGLQETYRRLLSANLWPSMPLEAHEGNPLTHDILTTLDIIHPKTDSDHFEEDPERLQRRLIAQGAPFIQRRGSFSSDSDHSTTHSHKRSRSVMDDTPLSSPIAKSFRNSIDHKSASQSPVLAATHMKSREPIKPSPLHTESPMADTTQPVEDDSLMTAWSWQDLPPEGLTSQEPQFTFPQDDALLGSWATANATQSNFDSSFITPFPFGLDLSLAKDPLDFDMGNFVPIAT